MRAGTFFSNLCIALNHVNGIRCALGCSLPPGKDERDGGRHRYQKHTDDLCSFHMSLRSFENQVDLKFTEAVRSRMIQLTIFSSRCSSILSPSSQRPV